MQECKNATQPRFAEPKLRQRQVCLSFLTSRLGACICTCTRNAKLSFGGPIGRRGVNPSRRPD